MFGWLIAHACWLRRALPLEAAKARPETVSNLRGRVGIIRGGKVSAKLTAGDSERTKGMGKSVFRSALKHAVERAAGLAGFEIVAKWRAQSLPLAKSLSPLFEHFGITSVIDIGANEGQYRDFLRDEVGFSGWIHSFEPDPDLAASLMKRAASHDARWKVFAYALGPAEGRQSFHRMGNSVFNSFRAPSPGQPHHFKAMNRVVRTFPVEMRTLDQLTQEFDDLAHTYIKIDTQGFDLEVLQGGRHVIRSVPALQTEVSCHAVYDGSPSFLQSIAAFQAEGFAISDLFIVSSDEGMRAVEFDCVMVRAA